MSHDLNEIKNLKIQEKVEKNQHRDSWTDYLFHRALYIVERFIAVITILALVAALFLEIYTMFTEPGYFANVNHWLHNLLTIVVGLEFVRMLIDTTPASVLEVLTVAIARHVVLSHEDPWSNVACIACIAGLFAIRRFLIRHSELKEEMVEID